MVKLNIVNPISLHVIIVIRYSQKGLNSVKSNLNYTAKGELYFKDSTKVKKEIYHRCGHSFCLTYELNKKCLKKNPPIKKFEWDHRKETYEYCKSDVEILCASMNVYSKNSMKIAGIDPLHFTTIASYCFSVFRTEFYNNEKYPLAI